MGLYEGAWNPHTRRMLAVVVALALAGVVGWAVVSARQESPTATPPTTVSAAPAEAGGAPTAEELEHRVSVDIRLVLAGDLDAANANLRELMARYPTCRFGVLQGNAPSRRAAGMATDAAIQRMIQVAPQGPPVFGTAVVKDQEGSWAWVVLGASC